MNTHQTPEQILSAASPEQKIIWNDIYLKFGERVSASQMHVMAALGGDISVYSANKLYLAYEFEATGPFVGVGNPIITFWDENNATQFYLTGGIVYWDVTAAGVRYTSTNDKIKNILFSRITASGYTHYKLTGYRLGI